MTEDTSQPAVTRVQVVVRVRPVLAKESPNEVAVSVAPDGTRVQVQLEKAAGSKELLPGSQRMGARAYSFDACMPGKTTQVELADVCGINELVEAALDGYNVVVLAFGQTGSGKTYTMIGPRLSRGQPSAGTQEVVADDDEDGLLPRCLESIYAGIEKRKESLDVQVTTSCVELYNEAVTDLLGADKSKQLHVRQDERGAFRVDGLNQPKCGTAASAMRHLSQALVHRHTRAHAMNEYSSRSHCLMSFAFSTQEKAQEGAVQGAQGGLRRYGKLVLVDLAGSERLKETGSTGREAVRETGSINKSLFTLGQTLSALAARSNRAAPAASLPHVPYRDSKLTQLLWDALRGNGRVLMLACLGPMSSQVEESLNTLHFASMASRITSEPVILLDPQDALVLDLRNTIKQLQQENKQLASAMSLLSSGATGADVLAALPQNVQLPSTLSGQHGAAITSISQPSIRSGRPPGLVVGQSPDEPGHPAAAPWDATSPHRMAKGVKPTQSDILRVSHGSSLISQHQAHLESLFKADPIDYSYSMGAGLGSRKSTKAKSPTKGRLQSKKSHPVHASNPSSTMKFTSIDLTGGISPSVLPNNHSYSSVGSAFAQPGLSMISPQPARKVALEPFPELAAMEAEFQQLLRGEVPAAAALTPSRSQAPEPPPVKPEPKAIHWAEINTWFGSNKTMTAYAYEVHDDLVNVQHMDAASDDYYNAIEEKVKTKFPEEWVAWEEEVAAKAAAAAAAAAAERARQAAAKVPASHNFGAALRAALKEPTPGEALDGLRAGSFMPQRGFANPNLLPAKSQEQILSAQGSAATLPVHRSMAPVRSYHSMAAGSPAKRAAPSVKLPSSNGSASSPLVSTRNLSVPSGSSSSSTPLSQSRQGSRLQPAASVQPSGKKGSLKSRTSAIQHKVSIGAWTGSNLPDMSWQDMHKEYLRHRQAVVEELRVAKEEAEVERARIIARIGQTLGSSRWRT